MANPLVQKYLLEKKLPTIFCAGCGYGIVIKTVMEAVDELGLLGKTVFLGGIGCSGRSINFLKAKSVRTLHGRALAVATGIKLMKPELNVVVFTGDGDCLAIGGNHFIHAARRNLDVTVLLLNNSVYGMTGGQVAPTTPHKAVTTTTPYGNFEPPVDACRLARAAGATYIARCAVTHPIEMKKVLKNAITHKGFSLVEVVSVCPTYAGRYIMGITDPAELFLDLKRRVVRVSSLDEKVDEGKVGIGELYKGEAPTLTEMLEETVKVRR